MNVITCGSTVVVVSNQYYDVLTCKRDHFTERTSSSPMCSVGGTTMPVKEYVKKMGYNNIVKMGVCIQGEDTLYVIEVSK